MNRHILVSYGEWLYPGKYTPKQLEQNANAAYNLSTTIADAAYTASAYAASDAAYTNSVDAAYWFNNYFKESGENKQDYIDAINKDK